MSRNDSSIVYALRSEFPNSALGLIGCHTSGEEYPDCEYDYLIISESEKRFERRVINGRIVDLLFLNEATLLNASEERFSLALTDLNIIADPKWSLKHQESRITAEAPQRLQRFARRTIFESLADLGRHQDSFKAGNLFEADFWLKSSGYNLAAAVVASKGAVPRISHLLAEFRIASEDAGDLFGSWSKIQGLDMATDVTVMRRLDALREVLGLEPSDTSKYAYQLAEARSKHLVKSHSVVDAYCNLGAELTRTIEEIYESKCRSTSISPQYQNIFSELLNSELRLQIVRLIGLTSEEALLKERSSYLKDAAKSIAKDISKE
ncbi:MAG: hypothetical protein M1503_04525 [Thaumarchaeota archaeon]|nr:hypothetical protein [Nitrososphaerota archaeon]MCL5317515.1 hypothetical protein [Nitrososphaerota archaeon]